MSLGNRWCSVQSKLSLNNRFVCVRTSFSTNFKLNLSLIWEWIQSSVYQASYLTWPWLSPPLITSSTQLWMLGPCRVLTMSLTLLSGNVGGTPHILLISSTSNEWRGVSTRDNFTFTYHGPSCVTLCVTVESPLHWPMVWTQSPCPHLRTDQCLSEWHIPGFSSRWLVVQCDSS
jgi:hypothetical protein